MGPGEIAPAEPPDPSALNLPFQVEAGDADRAGFKSIAITPGHGRPAIRGDADDLLISDMIATENVRRYTCMTVARPLHDTRYWE